jgi:hypothetical protein
MRVRKRVFVSSNASARFESGKVIGLFLNAFARLEFGLATALVYFWIFCPLAVQQSSQFISQCICMFRI